MSVLNLSEKIKCGEGDVCIAKYNSEEECDVLPMTVVLLRSVVVSVMWPDLYNFIAYFPFSLEDHKQR